MKLLEKINSVYEIRKEWNKFIEELENHATESMKNQNDFEKAHLALSLARSINAQIAAISVLLEESIK